MEYVGHDCNLEVELMLLHALCKPGYKSLAHFSCRVDGVRDRGNRCHTEKELILLGGNKYKSPWTKAFKAMQLEGVFKHDLRFRELAKEVPRKSFRNHKDEKLDQALLFEGFGDLPLELRLKIVSRFRCRDGQWPPRFSEII